MGESCQMDTLQFFRFLGIFVSFVAGVLATAFETKKEKTKGLNRTGQILLGFVVLGSFVSGITQHLEDRQQDRERKEAEKQRMSDVERLTFIINGTERLAHRLEPLEWRAVVRYRVDRKSDFWSYVQRIHVEHPNTIGFD